MLEFHGTAEPYRNHYEEFSYGVRQTHGKGLISQIADKSSLAFGTNTNISVKKLRHKLCHLHVFVWVAKISSSPQPMYQPQSPDKIMHSMTSKNTCNPHKKPTFLVKTVDEHVYRMHDRSIDIIHGFSSEAAMSPLVFVHNPNGTTYVYENISYCGKETKKSKHKRKAIGHLDPASGEIIRWVFLL